MLIRPADQARSEDEWKEFLRTHDFGQFVAPGRGRDVPVVVPTHFVYEDGDEVLFHLARPNPVWDALAENRQGLLTVVGAYTYVTAEMNTPPGESPEFGIPTSYYAAVQLTGEAEIVDELEELAALIDAQLRHFEPRREGPPVRADNLYGKSLPGIRGIRFRFDDVRAKFKFGGNRSPEHQASIGRTLRERGRDLDLEAAAIQERRLRDR